MNRLSSTFNQNLWRWRNLKDISARYGVAIGGVGVIGAIALIFFYLLAVVFPIFQSAEITHRATYTLSGTEPETLLIDLEEQGTIGVRYRIDGSAVFFNTTDGETVSRFQLPLPQGVTISAITPLNPAQQWVAIGTSSGEMLVSRHGYEVSYPDDRRTLTPKMEYPLGEELLDLGVQGAAITQLTIAYDEERIGASGRTADGRIFFKRWSLSESMLGDGMTVEEESQLATTELHPHHHILLTPNLDYLLTTTTDHALRYYAIEEDGLRLVEEIAEVAGHGNRVTQFQFLLGNSSVLVGGSDGTIAQWFPVRDAANNYHMQRVRSFHFDHGATLTTLIGEHRRKGIIAATAAGDVGLFFTTAERSVMQQPLTDDTIQRLALSPRGDTLLVEEGDGQYHLFKVTNEHPEISWSALWQKVWYEGYPEPDYIWQSSAATNDFEAKFSLVPLSFGTLKAAFYAMLFAMPLAIMGAIFTAQFMAPPMREVVKPTIEIMEALPTVILGFLAGLWLAPFIEANLPGIFSLLLILPLAILLTAYLFSRLSTSTLNRLEGWESLILVPVVVLFGWVAIALSTPLENLLFDGSMQHWMDQEFGVRYDQRNSMVVGFAMGFAVIPTIFSIAEDALFSVPQHLIRGSLALGASRWQTLVRVVMPTASPAIFSAVMMGFGRAVGETMIVLMATGNTPVLDFSVFEGMRTLSANIAVEMPESEVDSSHYRVLFLAALVLFLFTFLFNTAAEVVRQRLRKKYSSL